MHGNRLIMMWDGKIILDIKGEEKKNLTVDDLLHQFTVASGKEFANDRAPCSADLKTEKNKKDTL